MKAIICTEYGGPELLKYIETEDPSLGEKEVLIEVAACAVNFPDVLIIQNKYQFKPELPFSPGGEVAGVIASVGPGVKHLQIGQRVLALCGWGGFAEKVKVSADRVFPVPSFMDDITAASTLYTFGTAYHALKDRAEIKAGETLLVLGASGGVGLAAVELGKVMGAKVIAAASTAEKLAICQEKGAEHLINYETEDLKEKIKEITAGKGVDVVLDVVGDKYAEPALRSMAWKGRYLVVGFAAGEIPKLPFNLALLKGCAVMGVFWGRFSSEQPKQSQQNLMELVGMIQAGKIKQHIYKTYSLEEAPQALKDMMERKVVGKAVVVVKEKREIRKGDFGGRMSESGARKEEGESGKVVFRSVEDLRAFVGKRLGTSSWTRVSQEVIQKFAETTEDFQWIHVDTEKAKALIPGGKNLAHGYLTLSLAPKLLYEILPLEGVQMALNYGVNKVRFPAPVFSGDQVRLKASLTNLEDNPDGSLKLYIEAEMESDASNKPVCVAEMISMVRF
ncbi:zinc-binding dehydrogenase [Cecembia lonarensis]|uniref:Putative enoyl-CoA hydratase 1 n=1 Tax=Cecembia lonarensis (strain CCUG 58316 / KCTC 22772 / LW9) TaxID=1225176 RepID=K1M3M9_CECL9|nr:zinc-binding dehydrogenase [Cecembia lonarensis]EKB50864.1 putative enoyl-CoA hydratase 1 [Cecembia lonarensis LW9]